jgi:hypothetical protein
MPWTIQLSYVPDKIQTVYFRMQIYGFFGFVISLLGRTFFFSSVQFYWKKRDKFWLFIIGAHATSHRWIFMVTHNSCRFLEWDLIYVNLLSPRTLKWLLDFAKICASLLYYLFSFVYCHQYFKILTLGFSCAFSGEYIGMC